MQLVRIIKIVPVARTYVGALFVGAGVQPGTQLAAKRYVVTLNLVRRFAMFRHHRSDGKRGFAQRAPQPGRQPASTAPEVLHKLVGTQKRARISFD